MTAPLVVSLTEAAEMLGISRNHAYELAKRGEFPVPVLTVGTRKKVSRRALVAYVEGDAIQPGIQPDPLVWAPPGGTTATG